MFGLFRRPNITGEFIGLTNGYNGDAYRYNGAFELSTTSCPGASGGGSDNIANIDASRLSDIFGKQTTVQPPAVYALIMIKV